MKKRKLKPDLMNRTRAAVAYLNARGNNKREEMAAFLDIFHPDMPAARKKMLIQTS